MKRPYTDAEELFISQKVEHFLRKIMTGGNRYTHFSKASCSWHHRAEIYKRVKDILTISGIKFVEKREGYHGMYKIKIL